MAEKFSFIRNKVTVIFQPAYVPRINKTMADRCIVPQQASARQMSRYVYKQPGRFRDIHGLGLGFRVRVRIRV